MHGINETKTNFSIVIIQKLIDKIFWYESLFKRTKVYTRYNVISCDFYILELSSNCRERGVYETTSENVSKEGVSDNTAKEPYSLF